MTGGVQADEEEITEEELSGLYGRISAMRQREVEVIVRPTASVGG